MYFLNAQNYSSLSLQPLKKCCSVVIYMQTDNAIEQSYNLIFFGRPNLFIYSPKISSKRYRYRLSIIYISTAQWRILFLWMIAGALTADVNMADSGTVMTSTTQVNLICQPETTSFIVLLHTLNNSRYSNFIRHRTFVSSTLSIYSFSAGTDFRRQNHVIIKF